VYYDHERGGDQPGFARGEAGHGKLVETGGLASEMRVPIPANAYHALLGHGVVEELNRLALDGGPVGSGHEAWIRPAAAEQAAHILYEADRKTYGGSWEFVAKQLGRPGADAARQLHRRARIRLGRRLRKKMGMDTSTPDEES